MRIQNGRLRLELHPDLGTVVSLIDTASGTEHLPAATYWSQASPAPAMPGNDAHVDRPRLFRLLMANDRWSSVYADSVDGVRPRFATVAGGWQLHWEDFMAADGGRAGVGAALTVVASPRPDEILFLLTLTNHGTRTIEEIISPWLGGWTGYGGQGRDRLTLGGMSQAEAHLFPTAAGNNYTRNAERVTWEYPVRLHAPWVDVSGPASGLGLLNYMPAAQNGYFLWENVAAVQQTPCLAFGWAHSMLLRPGEVWHSPPVGVFAHDGNWRCVADRFRQWFEQEQCCPRRPALATMGFQNVFFSQFDGAPCRPFGDIPELARQGREVGVDHLCVWDALTLGNYARRGPEDLLEYTGEEAEALSSALKQAAAEESQVSALINFRHPNWKILRANPQLEQHMQRRLDGSSSTENWSGSACHGSLWAKRFGPESRLYSPFSQVQRERVLALTKRYLDLGYTSMFYDQPFELQPDYSASDHGASPLDTHAAALSIIAAVRKLILSHDPKAIVIGEECDLLATPWVDMWMSWRVSNLNEASNVALSRYSVPHTMQSWVVDYQPERVAQAFAMGMYLCLMLHRGEGALADEPALATLIGRLAELRRRTADQTVRGRFVDQQGLTVSGDEGLVAYAYESAQGPAVIAAAVGKAAGGKLTLETPGSGSPGRLLGLDGEETGVAGQTLEVRLQPNEATVWLP